MEKGKKWAANSIVSSLKNIELDPTPNVISSSRSRSRFEPFSLLFKTKQPRRLVSLCLGVLGQHFEDILPDLVEISSGFPSDIKLAMVAIARRKKLLNDDILIALAESSWYLLDISGSDVTNVGLAKVSQICTYLRAVDISQCEKITAEGVSDLILHCRSLETLRCGGCPRSNSTARRCLWILKPHLNDVEEESWEELDSSDIGIGASIRWLVWPKIDMDSKLSLETECPRIIVNPQPSPICLRGIQIPAEALATVALDHSIVADIDPKTWAFTAVRRTLPLSTSASTESPEIPMAERFRLAFVERDTRLAPKRAKNERQRQRREERDRLMRNTDAKSLALASQAGKILHNLK